MGWCRQGPSGRGLVPCPVCVTAKWDGITENSCETSQHVGQLSKLNGGSGNGSVHEMRLEITCEELDGEGCGSLLRLLFNSHINLHSITGWPEFNSISILKGLFHMKKVESTKSKDLCKLHISHFLMKFR